MTQYHFPVVLEPDRAESWRCNVRVPAQPGCPTYGQSLEDPLANAHEAIAGYVESLLADGEPIPREGRPAIAATIVVTPDAAERRIRPD